MKAVNDDHLDEKSARAYDRTLPVESSPSDGRSDVFRDRRPREAHKRRADFKGGSVPED